MANIKKKYKKREREKRERKEDMFKEAKEDSIIHICMSPVSYFELIILIDPDTVRHKQEKL
jgi:hypothetical protein